MSDEKLTWADPDGFYELKQDRKRRFILPGARWFMSQCDPKNHTQPKETNETPKTLDQ